MSNMILVTGCAMSAMVSTVALLRSLGVDFGATNASGENAGVRERLEKPFLHSIHVDPLGQYPLPAPFQVCDNIRQDWRARVETELGGAEALQSAKMALMWQQWHDAFPDAKWVIVRHDDEDIIRSCLLTPFMKAYREATGWQAWIDVHKQRFEEMKMAGLDVVEFWPERLSDGDTECFRDLVNHLDLVYDEATALKQSRKLMSVDSE